jgi:chaperone LolA
MRILFLLFALALGSAAHAGGVERLKAFIAGAKTAEADFTQTVADKAGRVTQEASGRMAFARPGKFRWYYKAPYEQVIVGDGDKLWLYDADLDQVTVKPLGDVIAGTPAALLAGDNDREVFQPEKCRQGRRPGMAGSHPQNPRHHLRAHPHGVQG